MYVYYRMLGNHMYKKRKKERDREDIYVSSLFSLFHRTHIYIYTYASLLVVRLFNRFCQSHQFIYAYMYMYACNLLSTEYKKKKENEVS